MEIREIIIRAAVREPAIGRRAGRDRAELSREDFDRIVEACLRRLNHRRRKSKER
ncbi:MAG: DUF5908 family protein [Myxococcota bacterium]